MKDLYFDSEKHEYYYKGEKVPCVSDILSMIDTIAMRGVPQRNIQNAGEKGKRIHEQIEDYCYGVLEINEEWQEENCDIEPYIQAFMQWAKDTDFTPYLCEEPLYGENTRVAGTIDLLYRRNGKLVLTDNKTAKTLSKLRCTIQLNIYRLNWNDAHEEKVNDLSILQIKDNGEYREIPIEINENLAKEWIAKYYEIKGDKKL